MNNKIGVITDSFRLGLQEGIIKAKDVGAEGIQLYAVRGEMLQRIYRQQPEENY